MTFIHNKKLLLFTVFAAIAVLLLLMTAPAGAEIEPAEQPDPQRIIAELYAERFEVTINEALYRLSLQDAFPDLGPELEANETATFGGLWIQHEPEYKIVVAFTRNGERTISKYNEYIPENVAPYIELRTVDKSLAELLSDQERLFLSLDKQGIRIDSYVDIRNNCVDIDIAKKDKTKFDLAKQEEKFVIPDKLKIDMVDSLSIPTTDIYGGLTLDYWQGGGAYCTSGFSVNHFSSGNDGIITAGHADDVTLYYSGNGLPYYWDYVGYSYDVQWHTVPGLDAENKIRYWSSGSTLSITAVKSRGQQNVGDIVSKYGMTTHYTAGEIISKTAYGNVPNSSATWMLVDNIFGYQKLVDQGDSGGPWFSGNTALGISHARSQDYQQAYYMAINYINVLGVSVKTS